MAVNLPTFIETAYEYGTDLTEAFVQGGKNAVHKTARAVGEFIHHHPAIAGMTVNHAMQASFVAAISLTGLAQVSGFYEAVYGPNNSFNQFGATVTHAIAITGILCLRTGRAPELLNQLTVGDLTQSLRQW